MYPSIKSGDWADVSLWNGEERDIKKGDVVLFKKDESLYMHRVIRITKSGVILKGDISFGHDGAIFRKDIIGRVVSVERDGRSIDLRSKTNRLIAVTIANTSLLMQYPVLLVRKAFSLGMAIFSRIQGITFYRRTAKKLIPAEMSIREATPEDADEIRDLFLMAGHDLKKDIIDIKREGFWLVANRNKKIVGALTITRFEKDPTLWVIFGLEVKPLLRGLGIGEGIVREAIRKAAECGAKEIGLFVNKKATAALGLYRKLGFKIREDFPTEFNRSADELYLSYKFDSLPL